MPDEPELSDAARAAIDAAAAVLRAGGVVGFPTESFYGLAALALDARAVASVIAAKGRAPEAPIACVAADAAQAAQLWQDPPPPAALALAAAHWPGALTIVAPARAAVPAPLVGAAGVGVRVPAHAWACALAAAAGAPITATSANRSGQPPTTTVAAARAQLGDAAIHWLDGGTTAGGAPSTVVEVSARSAVRVVRAGAVTLTREELAPWPR